MAATRKRRQDQFAQQERDASLAKGLRSLRLQIHQLRLQILLVNCTAAVLKQVCAAEPHDHIADQLSFSELQLQLQRPLMPAAPALRQH